MVEQIQPTPPYEVLTSFNATASNAANEPAKNSTSSLHSGTHTATGVGGKDDTVTLSESAQASQLYLQGNSVSQIAALLGLPPATIDNDLNLSVSSTQADAQKVQQTGGASALTQSSAATSSSPFNANASTVTAASLSTANVS